MRGSNRGTATRVEIAGDAISIAQRLIAIPNVRPTVLVGAGANGVVVRGEHKYLNRIVAVKIWLQRRPGDDRDKIMQGIEECRKAAAIDSSGVARIFDVGMLDGCVYAVMEYVDGVTLKTWLCDYAPNLFTRMVVAERLTNEVFRCYFEGIVHGDVHGGNVMILPPYRSRLINRIADASIVLVDFGTSCFSGRRNSETRHWRVFTQTYADLLKPFDIRRFDMLPTKAADGLERLAKYINFLDVVKEILYSFNLRPRAPSDDSVDWVAPPQDTSPFFLHERWGPEIRRLFLSGQLKLTPELIGIREDGAWPSKDLVQGIEMSSPFKLRQVR